MRTKKTNKEEKKVVEKKIVHKEPIKREEVKKIKNKALDDKLARIGALQKEMEKKYADSKNLIMMGNELKPVEFMSTGVTGLDQILGGGWANDRVIGITGNQSSGKSTIALMTIAYNQKIDPTFTAYYGDVEKTLDVDFAKALGVDMSRVFVNKISSAEAACTALRDAIKSGDFNIAILDSTGMLGMSKFETEDVTNITMGTLATLLSQAYRQWADACAKTKCPLLVIEHIQKALGVMFGNNEVYSVGRKGLYTFSQQIILRAQSKMEKEGTGSDAVAFANEVTVKCVKNKVSAPFRACTLRNVFGKGFDALQDVTDLAIKYNVIEKNGNTYTYKDNKFVGQGKVYDFVINNPNLYDELHNAVMDEFKKGNSVKALGLSLDDNDVKTWKKMEEDEIKNTSKDVDNE